MMMCTACAVGRSNRPVACRNAGGRGAGDAAGASLRSEHACTNGNHDPLGSDAEAVEAGPAAAASGPCGRTTVRPRAHGDASCRRRQLCGSHACVPGPLLCRVPSGRPADRCSCGLLWPCGGSQLVVGAYSRDITANLATSFRAMIGSAFPTVAQPGL